MRLNNWTLSVLSARKRRLNQLCAKAIEQRISLHPSECTQLRARRRHLAKEVKKRLPLITNLSIQDWSKKITLLLAAWGFSGLLVTTSAQADALFFRSINTLNVDQNAKPTFADIDNDGDLDVFIGNEEGEVRYYRNTQIDQYTPGRGFVADIEGSPFYNVPFQIESNAHIRFVDIDNDGDLDAFIGNIKSVASGNYNSLPNDYGYIRYFRNTQVDLLNPGSGFVSDDNNNPFVGIDFGDGAFPSFADIDGDGDVDAFIGTYEDGIRYYRNTQIDNLTQGNGFVADVEGNPLSSVHVSSPSPSFADIDADGDLDAIIGGHSGNINYYRNTQFDTGEQRNGFIADIENNPFSAVDVDFYSSPTFSDLDGDGDMDAFIGGKNGHIRVYRNTQIDTEMQGSGFVIDTGGNPFGINTRSQTYDTKPSFADIDGDGDIDLYISDVNLGSKNPPVRYYRNTKVDQMTPGEGFVADPLGNPLTGEDFFPVFVSFVDLDDDGDIDAFNGTYGFSSGLINYYRNTRIDSLVQGSGFVADIANNPFKEANLGFRTEPKLSFADFDNDGDLDAVIGTYYDVKYYRNTQIDTLIQGNGFVPDVESNPLAAASNVRGNEIPSFADLDSDGDLDAFIGRHNGKIRYYRNTQIDTLEQGIGFVADSANNPFDGVDVGRNATPSFYDIDDDGDLDAFVGNNGGVIVYLQNIDPDPVTVEDMLTVESGTSSTTSNVTANDMFKVEAPGTLFSITTFDTTTENGGSVLDNGDNTFTYIGTNNFTGTDSFSYTVGDGAGNTAIGIVTVSVTADITSPIVNIILPSTVNADNAGSYKLEGGCSIGDGSVTVSTSGLSDQEVNCSEAGTWSITLDISGIADGSNAIMINVSQTDIAANTGKANVSLDKYTVPPVIIPPAKSGGILSPWLLWLLPLVRLFRWNNQLYFRS